VPRRRKSANKTHNTILFMALKTKSFSNRYVLGICATIPVGGAVISLSSIHLYKYKIRRIPATSGNISVYPPSHSAPQSTPKTRPARFRNARRQQKNYCALDKTPPAGRRAVTPVPHSALGQDLELKLLKLSDMPISPYSLRPLTNFSHPPFLTYVGPLTV
jgi:hypothetical protein